MPNVFAAIKTWACVKLQRGLIQPGAQSADISTDRSATNIEPSTHWPQRPTLLTAAGITIRGTYCNRDARDTEEPSRAGRVKRNT